MGSNLNRRDVLRVMSSGAASLALTGLGRAEGPQGRNKASRAPDAQQGQLAAEVIAEVIAGEHDRQDTPVYLELPPPMRSNLRFSLTRLDTGRRLNVQRLPGNPPRIVWLLEQPLRAGRAARYRLMPATDDRDSAPAVSCHDDGKRLLVKVGDRPVLQYHQTAAPPPPGMETHYARSGHIHPLWNPAGQAVTDDFPPDHPHQHGVFLAWVNTTFEGRQVSFWDQAARLGRVEHVRLDAYVSGSVCAQFTAALRHSDLTAPGGPKAVLNETWTVRVYSLSDYFVFDLESRQRCAGDSPLKINKLYYGGMSIRGSRQWFGQTESGFLTAEGKGRKDGNQTRPRWVDMHGKIDGQFSGVTVMDHPDNFRFPQPVRLHPDKPYFCFAPMVLGPWSIAPGREYVSRYRYCVHTGKPDQALAKRLWHDFAHPPKARIVNR